MRTLGCGGPVRALRGGSGIERHQSGAAKAIMSSVDRTIQYRDTNLGVTAAECEQNFLLEFCANYPYHRTPPALASPHIITRTTRMCGAGVLPSDRRPFQNALPKNFALRNSTPCIFLIDTPLVFLSRAVRRENGVNCA